MYKFIKNNQKKMMAVLGVGLMIVFILPTTFTQMGRQNPVVAKMGDRDIHYADFAQAERDWQTLMSVPTIIWNMGQPQIAPLPFLLGMHAVQQINQHSELYVILQHEAAAMGVYPNEEQLNQILASPVIGTAQVDVNSPAVRGAVARFLPVLDAWRRLGGTIKITDPMVRHELAGEQVLQVSLVSFDATPATQPATQPSTDALQQQFQRFANVSPGQPDAKNPFGFGYRYPNQVSVQYITVPFAQVREVVEKSRSPYQWQVEENRYYLQHATEFATTRPATESTTRPASRPAVKPFESVQHEIHEKLVHEQTQALAKTVQDRITATLSADYTPFARAATRSGDAASSSGDASTRPATSLGAPYDSFDYLQKLRDMIEAETHVRITLHQVADPMSEEALNTLPQIAHATYKGLSFPQYAIEAAAPFANPAVPETERLALFQPSGVLTNSTQDTFVFRLTGAQPAHAPKSLDEVRDQVVADLQKAAAFEHAKSAAQQLLDAASQPDASLAQAARAAGKDVLQLGPIHRGSPVPQYPLSGVARQNFERQLQDLLHAAALKDHPHPLTLIELPTAGKVAVAQLKDVQALWDQETQALAQLQIDRALREQMTAALEQGWFDFDAVVRRTRYQRTDRPAQAPQQAPPPPLF